MTLSQEEMFKRNLELTKQRLLKEIDAPKTLEWIPPNARIINLPKNAPELLKANLELALGLAQKQEEGGVVLIPEPGFEMPWSELTPLVSGKRIDNIGPVPNGTGFELTFDDGTTLMFVAIKQAGAKGYEQLIISLGRPKETVA